MAVIDPITGSGTTSFFAAVAGVPLVMVATGAELAAGVVSVLDPSLSCT